MAELLKLTAKSSEVLREFHFTPKCEQHQGTNQGICSLFCRMQVEHMPRFTPSFPP